VLSRELVLSKVTSHFSRNDIDDVVETLDLYDSTDDEGRYRVQLAILKLAKGEPTRVRELVGVALEDYRDVLVTAESPRQNSFGMWEYSRLPKHEQRRIADEDRAEYLDWLDAK
jgi:hypothetical protein